MRFEHTSLEGVVVVHPRRIEDERGYFARTFDAELFAREGLCHRYPQQSVSFNIERGTLRGLHLQRAPHAETKLVRCSRGAVFDVAVDVRRASATFGHWFGIELRADEGTALYIPEGYAHGFQVIESASEVHYMISADYRPEASIGVRWDDPTVAVQWPLSPTRISERDRALPTLESMQDAL